MTWERIGMWCLSDDDLHEKLMERGLAVRLGEPFPPTAERAPDDLARVVERIKSVMRAE